MNKKLEEAWITICHYNDEFIHDMGSEYVENPLKKEIDIVNNALLELKAIKEANPSEAIKKLDDISYLVLNEIDDLKNKELWKSYFNTIKQALIKAQEQEKENDRKDNLIKYYESIIREHQQILKIIKEKRVDIESFYKTFIEDDFNYLDYQIMYGTYGLELLTEEEFDLLKRWLG